MQEHPVAPFGQVEPIPGRDVEIAHAGVPGSLQRLHCVLVGNDLEFVPERHAAETEPELRREDLTGAPWDATARGRRSGGGIGARPDGKGTERGARERKEVAGDIYNIRWLI